MRSLIIVFLALFLSSCVRNKHGFVEQGNVPTGNPEPTMTETKIFKVKEVIQPQIILT